MNFTSSALKDHYLSSILPYQQYQKPKQFSKNTDFYKPEKFVWNNPHRSSLKIYKYYHLQNDQFNQTIKPQIQELQDQDRKTNQESRISKLTQMRNVTRHRFHTRRKERQELQTKTRSSFSVNKHYFTMQSIGGFKKEKDYRTANKGKTQLSFLKGVSNYDLNLESVQKMMGEQIFQKHKKIRSTFQKRKEQNEFMNSRIKKRTFTKTEIK